MDEIVVLRDAERISTHFVRHRALHIYELGDLDPFLWPRTRWYGLQNDARIRAIILEYQSPQMTSVLALGRDDGGATAELFSAIQDRLPPRYYSHLTPGLAIRAGRPARGHGQYLKMVLAHPNATAQAPTNDVVLLTPQDLPQVEAFYRDAYPGNWFDARMLHTGQYYGIRIEGELSSVAGVHVYSPSRRVAALGNIATRPDARGRGLAQRVTAAVCASVLSHADTVGLNVKTDNDAALALYRRLGFETVGPYEEWLMEEPGAGQEVPIGAS